MENLIYMDESNIDDNLKCEFCKKPFIDPVSLPCGQTFCLKCIKSNHQNHSNNCSECNQKSLTDQDFQIANRPIRNMIDNLLVKCYLCDQQNIRRTSFTKHIQQFCQKRIVFCRANDVKCQWNGRYDQLDQHVNICPYQKIRTDLTQLINDNKQLQTDFDNLQNHSKQQQNIIQQYIIENNQLTEQFNQKLNQLIDQNKTLNEQINQIEKMKIENQHLNEQSEQQLDQINKLKNENQFLNEEINKMKQFQIKNVLLNEEIDKMKEFQIRNKSLTEESSQQLNQINNLKIEYKLIQDQYQIEINYYENYLEDLQSVNQNLLQQLQEQQKENQQLKQFQQQSIQNQLTNQQIKDLQNIQTDNQQLKQQSIQYQLQIEQLIINIKRLESKLNKPIFRPKELCDDNNNNKLKELIDQCQKNSLINLNGEIINDNSIEIVINNGLINKQCQSIILSQNNLTSNSILRLSSYLNINKTLTKLIISNNYLSDLSIKYLSESLSFNNSTLKHLILNSNQINDQGFIYLSDMFKSNQTIINFGLQDNQITDKSIEYFCKIIQSYNKVIQEISLYSNKLITDLSIQSIYDMIINNNSLKTFWIWDCQLSEQGKYQLQQSIQTKIDFDLRL